MTQTIAAGRHQQRQAAHRLLTGHDHRAHDDVLRRQLPQHQGVEDVVASDGPVPAHHHDSGSTELVRQSAIRLRSTLSSCGQWRSPVRTRASQRTAIATPNRAISASLGRTRGTMRPGVHAHDERSQEDQQVRRRRRPGHDQVRREGRQRSGSPRTWAWHRPASRRPGRVPAAPRGPGAGGGIGQATVRRLLGHCGRARGGAPPAAQAAASQPICGARNAAWAAK